MNIIPSFYFISNNFGDALTPYILKNMTGREVGWVDSNSDISKYMVTGSILNHGNNNCIVWGCGLAGRYDQVIQKDIRLVRGKLTAQIIKEQNISFDDTKYGDPALILSDILNVSEKEKEFISIAPHYIDAYEVSKGNVDDLQWIDVNDSIENVVNKITSSKIVFTSSLHIIITCHSYKIPVVWCQFTNNILGDGTKYYDHYLSMGLDQSDIKCFDLRNNNNYKHLFNEVFDTYNYVLDVPENVIRNIKETFPL
jgi:pyruvyltransferase